MDTNRHSKAKAIVLYKYLEARQHTFVNHTVVRNLPKRGLK